MNSNTMLTCEYSNDGSCGHRPPPAVSITMFAVESESGSSGVASVWLCSARTLIYNTYLPPSHDSLLSRELDMYFLKSFCICCQQAAHAGLHFGLTPDHLAFSRGTSLPSGWLQSLPAGGVHLPILLPRDSVICFYFPAARIPDLKQPQVCEGDIVGKRKLGLRTYF